MKTGLTSTCAAATLLTLALQGCGSGSDTENTLACEQITTGSLNLQGVTVSGTEAVDGGSFTPPGSTRPLRGLPAFCRVTVALKPSASSNINAEIWMPRNWNGKLVAVGNGGLAGTISYADMAPALAKGYATASTDTGHVASDTTWLPNREKQYEYMSGSVHEMTAAAKNVLPRFYGRAASRAYYQGCSTGGGQGFSAVQRFPTDFDGVIAGAPQNFPTHFRAALVYDWQLANASPATVLPTATLANVTKAVLNQCGGAAAATDGFLMNPQACAFDPRSMQCAEGQSGDACLSAAQVGVVSAIYTGLRSPTTGVSMWPGFPVGSEQPVSGGGWAQHGTSGGQPFNTASLFFRIGVLEQPSFDLKLMDFHQTVQRADQLFGDVINSISTDIRPFTGRGGKLLMYHGWVDPLIAPQNSINYYETLVAQAQSRGQVEESTRLFMVPGMGHCSGGPGATAFDSLDVLDAWVERGQAPARIEARSTTTPIFSRPLCPYPQTAEYAGTGERTLASNWRCVASPAIADIDFYRRGLNVF